MKNIKPKIITVVGPTASGKTAVGVKLAQDFNGEVISADSRQVYRDLDLGTAKEGTPQSGEIRNSKPEIRNKLQIQKSKFQNEQDKNNSTIQQLRCNLRCIDNIPQWMIDICEPEADFNLFKYLKLARLVIEDILSRGKVPIIVGGTGLYVQALTEGFSLKSEINSKFKILNSKFCSREQLNNLTIQQLQKILMDIDIEVFNNLTDKKNPHRLIRAIERAQEGLKMTKTKPSWEVLQIGLKWPREILNQRIDKRVDDRFKEGMLEEVVDLLNSGVGSGWLIGLGLEYRIITKFLISNYTNYSNQTPMTKSQVKKLKASDEFKEMAEELKLRSHQYAKRQMTWYRRFPDIVWENEYSKIESIAKKFLN